MKFHFEVFENKDLPALYGKIFKISFPLSNEIEIFSLKFILNRIIVILFTLFLTIALS